MTTDAVGGVWTNTLDLSAGLVARGARVTLAVLGPAPASGQANLTARLTGLTLVPTGLPLDWMAADLREAQHAAGVIGAMARRSGADLVHLASPSLAVGARPPGPVVVTCHSCAATWWRTVHDRAVPPEQAWQRALAAEGYQKTNHLIAPTRAFASQTAQEYEMPVTPTAVHHGRRHDGYATDPVRDCIFTSGRLWDEGKAAGVIDAAAALLDHPIYAAGSLAGPAGNRFAPRHLVALGWLPEPEIRRWVARTAIFVSAAIYEPFGLSVLEAAQAGCALVLADTPTFRELWDGAAVFVEAGSAAGFAAAIAQLCDDQPRQQALAAAALARAAGYTVAAMAAATIQIYQQALSSVRVGA